MPDLTVIAPEGNVILVVGPDKKRVLVGSWHLEAASPFFKALITGPFKEGFGPASSQPREVALPDDDYNQVMIFCNAVHFRIEEIPKRLDAQSLFDFAIFVDKYHCYRGVAAWVNEWIRVLKEDTSKSSLMWLLEACYVLKFKDDFRSVSSTIIKAWEPDWAGAIEYARIPVEAWDELDFIARRAKEDIRAAVEEFTCFEQVWTLANYADDDERHDLAYLIGQYMIYLRRNGLWPASKLPESVMACAEHFSGIDYLDQQVFYDMEKNKRSQIQYTHEAMRELQERIRTIHSTCHGICFDCVKEGKRIVNGQCGVNH